MLHFIQSTLFWHFGWLYLQIEASGWRTSLCLWCHLFQPSFPLCSSSVTPISLSSALPAGQRNQFHNLVVDPWVCSVIQIFILTSVNIWGCLKFQECVTNEGSNVLTCIHLNIELKMNIMYKMKQRFLVPTIRFFSRRGQDI